PLGQVRSLFRGLPADDSKEKEARAACEQLRDEVLRLRKSYESKPTPLRVRGISPGSQPLVLWQNRMKAARRMSPPEGDDAPDVREFCRVFPDTFAVSERPPYFEANAKTRGRLLTAGFHLMQGYFRDDAPLYELVLDDAERRELDGLWRELNFVTDAPARQYRDFIFFERAEPPRFMFEAAFDFARSEDRDSVSPEKMARLRAAYIEKARRVGASEDALRSMETYFDEISASVRAVETAREAARPKHTEALLALARRAYRRPLTPAERDDLIGFYRALREQDGLSHEDALRDVVASLLVSPKFGYRVDQAGSGPSARPVSDHALASRLSYFLWASMPDDELFSHADAGDLHEPAVLKAQARRMLRDPKARGFATEFGGQWLGFRRFEEHNGVDRERFPTFTNDLRRAMFEEPVRFLVDVMSRDRRVLDLIDSDDTFVNPLLARHYGLSIPSSTRPDEWVRVAHAGHAGRGGLLPMGVFLTANSPGLRTSPVKRGFWVVRRVLGEHIPAPPPQVPELPKDEASTGDLTVPQLLAKHRAVKSCAGCHDRFDSVGLVFEGYGPVGERRDRDLAGRPVESKASFPDGSEGEGLEGLRRYLTSKRRDDFLAQVSRELLSYALGRGLIPSDEPTLAKMRESSDPAGPRFGGMVEAVVLSPQFLQKRGRDDPRD
ncbi:MAG: DUF1592 domain-containing protein, partial [Isosphaeraceae bacterium]